ncbi:hypothetical protein I2I11_10810 [Pontibacter sp. 172403-2]|uniref:hypothetical protein n=1 Tax=Pontibacter rufus TaxID=2791028 RepID=UPI0018AFC08E|nr:hypothetical protein [Pontibacter sp. 172403-2]MBF9253785.1 hypothetical protein [Pontibacter sp. 172403-2]
MKHTFLYVCLLLFSASAFTSCSDSGETQQQEPDQALTDYENFVTEFEQDSLSEVELRAMQQAESDSLSWAKMKQNRQQQFEQLKSNVQDNQESYSPAQRAEIQGLEQRYAATVEKRDQQYAEVSRRYKLRRQLLGLEVNEDDMSEITAANIASTYRQFVEQLQQQESQLDNRDWEMVQGWWVTLNNRRRAVEDTLSVADKRTIEELTQQYQVLIKPHI